MAVKKKNHKNQHRVADIYFTYTIEKVDEGNTKEVPGKPKFSLKIH